MRPAHCLKALILTLAVFSINSCASFKPAWQPQELRIARSSTSNAVEGGLEISLEEFFTVERSQKAFDADLPAHGILPLLFRVTNAGTEDFKVIKSDIKVSLSDQPLAAISAERAAERARMAGAGEYVARAAFWTIATGPMFIIAWPATILGTTLHTQSVNQKISNYFRLTEFRDGIIRPRETQAGFVYFEVPGETKTLAGLFAQAEGFGMESNMRFTYKFALPILSR
jgi:hypothetical protein